MVAAVLLTLLQHPEMQTNSLTSSHYFRRRCIPFKKFPKSGRAGSLADLLSIYCQQSTLHSTGILANNSGCASVIIGVLLQTSLSVISSKVLIFLEQQETHYDVGPWVNGPCSTIIATRLQRYLLCLKYF